MLIGNLNIDGILFLAPLAGVSSHSFRMLARKYGADLCYTEMVSSDALVHNQEKTFALIDTTPEEHPVGIQLFGSSPENMGRAVRKLTRQLPGPDLIDLNLGCPVKKVVRKNGGAALLKDLALTSEIMAAAVENSSVPITIKMRTGWEAESDAYIEAGKIAERAGISAITLHPRSRSDGFSGKSDWSKIAELKKEVAIPVIGNGDIRTARDAADIIFQTHCDAIMVGRAAMKNPFVLRQIKVYLSEQRELPDLTAREMAELALEHLRLAIDQFGEKRGTLKMRKHLAWYSKGFTGGAILRDKLKLVSSYNDALMLLDEFINMGRAHSAE
jgi:tRNA-dihydrouridine synthase B